MITFDDGTTWTEAPNRKELIDTTSKKWDKIFTKFKKDVAKMIQEAGGTQNLDVGVNGKTIHSLHLIFKNTMIQIDNTNQ
jgi:hypothetical protein